MIKSKGIAWGAQAKCTGEKLWDVLRSHEISAIAGYLVVVMWSVIALGTSLLIFCDMERPVPIAAEVTLLLICLFLWINAQAEKKRDVILIGVFVASFLVAAFTLHYKLYGTKINLTVAALMFAQGIIWTLIIKVWYQGKHAVFGSKSQASSYTV